MISDQEYLKEWEEMINTVEKTNIPMEYINRVVITFRDGSPPKTIDVEKFREQGYRDADIEDIITTVLAEAPEQVYGSLEFTLDVANVAAEVQQHTEIILKNI